ncbi:hypothetical protein AB0G35_23765 [Streptomyces sp. NPDC021749]|uniref:hypothetical protein n=1 Tax=Streptomyces sp. NPDC021749 TaxID=3154905 RepID=UPI0033FF9901
MTATGRAEPAAAVRTVAPSGRLVTFIQNEEPAIKAGKYTITAKQITNQQQAAFVQTRRFAVAGERFSIDPKELAGVFPPDLAAGELSGVLPHVLLSRRTLPWERTSVPGDSTAPWLAVLLIDDGQAPVPVRRTASDLIPAGTTITVAGSSVTGTGALPADFASCPGLNPLDYGETPDDACMTIDLDAALFSSIAPARADLPFLAHIREADTVDTQDTVQDTSSLAVVLGNRVPQDGITACAYLVSLENMAPLLPAADGSPAPALDGITTVRLVTYRWWSFTAAAQQAATFAQLLEGVNAAPDDQDGTISSLQLPFTGPRPTAAQVQQALNDQADGHLTSAQAITLANHALALGYVPLTHRLRHGGRTASWYRGPLTPLAVTTTVATPASRPDAVTRYDPQTGMFDVSYAAAWQLGRLLGLQSRSFAVALYNWRSRLRTTAAARADQAACEQVLTGAFESVLGSRAARLTFADPQPPDPVVDWLARLALLDGVPFSYLVPDERMLPPESLRMFHLDRAWSDALVDGALSIGRAGAHTSFDAAPQDAVRTLVRDRGRQIRPNPLPAQAPADSAITGFLLRSAAIAGWPAAAAAAWADVDRQTPLNVLRSVRLGTDVLLCLFDGVVEVAALHEPPGQLHCGVEGKPGNLTTTLRQVNGTTPGRQYGPSQGQAPVPARTDHRTLQVAVCATGIKDVLNSRFSQGLSVFTSAEFALQLVQGVVEVEFRRSN